MAADALGRAFIFVAVIGGKGNPLRSALPFCKTLFLLRKNRKSFSILFAGSNRIKGLSDRDPGAYRSPDGGHPTVALGLFPQKDFRKRACERRQALKKAVSI
tara:strand:+ start:612 stop:917 length:306 start_codon:yes stop_codon:yes gene_type:complete